MRLTPRAQGMRVGHPDWRPGYSVHIERVGSGQVKTVRGTDSEGKRVLFMTRQSDTGFFRVPKEERP